MLTVNKTITKAITSDTASVNRTYENGVLKEEIIKRGNSKITKKYDSGELKEEYTQSHAGTYNSLEVFEDGKVIRKEIQKFRKDYETIEVDNILLWVLLH